MQAMDTFTRRTIVTLCAMEAHSTANDPDYFGDADREGEIPVFHAEPREDHNYPASFAPLMRENTLHVAIVDQYGFEAGHALIFPDSATFIYAIVTG